MFLDSRQILGTFQPNQTIEVYDRGDVKVGSAKIVEWDRNFFKLTLNELFGNFEEIAFRLQQNTQAYRIQVNSNNQARVGRVVLINSQSVHHFEGENGLYLDPHAGLLDSYILNFSSENVVTNYQYENTLNDEKRKIVLPSRRLMEKIRQDLKNLTGEE
jgi:hypothetical protein